MRSDWTENPIKQEELINNRLKLKKVQGDTKVAITIECRGKIKSESGGKKNLPKTALVN